MKMSENLFWGNVNLEGPIPSHVPGMGRCWVWTGGKDKDGYGISSKYVGLTNRAHRISWAIRFGKIPDGVWVLHRCDNPSCINPDHLFLGTAKDNHQDMLKKGRQNPPSGRNHWSRRHPELKSKISGENHYRATLSKWQVREIRRLYNARIMTQRKMAALFGVGHKNINKIVHNINWVSA